MKNLIFILTILIILFKTGNVLSNNSIFNVNNVEIEKKDKITNDILANRAIKKGFNQLLKRILLTKDVNRLSDLKFSNIKELVIYYQITNFKIITLKFPKITKYNNIS